MIQIFFDNGKGEQCREYPDECMPQAELLLNAMQSRLIVCRMVFKRDCLVGDEGFEPIKMVKGL